MGDNPALDVYYQVFTGTIDPTVPDMPKMCFVAKITYSVLFSDPKELAQS